MSAFPLGRLISASSNVDEVLSIGMLSHLQKMTLLAYQPSGTMRIHAHNQEFLNCMCRPFALSNDIPKAHASLGRAGFLPAVVHCLPLQHVP